MSLLLSKRPHILGHDTHSFLDGRLLLLVRTALLRGLGRVVNQLNNIDHIPKPVRHASGHRRGHFDGRIDPGEIVPNCVEGNHVAVVLELLAVGVRQPRERRMCIRMERF